MINSKKLSISKEESRRNRKTHRSRRAQALAVQSLASMENAPKVTQKEAKIDISTGEVMITIATS